MYIAVAGANIIAVPILTHIGTRCVPTGDDSIVHARLPWSYYLTHASIRDSGNRMYQKTVLFMTVVVTLLTLGGLWVALVQTQLAVGSVPADDGSGSADGTLSDRAVRRQQVVVATFLAVELLVRVSSFRTRSLRTPVSRSLTLRLAASTTSGCL
jgi:hypothetical protein